MKSMMYIGLRATSVKQIIIENCKLQNVSNVILEPYRENNGKLPLINIKVKVNQERITIEVQLKFKISNTTFKIGSIAILK